MRRMRNFAIAGGLAALAEVAASVLFFGGAALGVVPGWAGLVLLYPAMVFGHVLGADSLPAGRAILVQSLLAFAQFLLIFWMAIEILDWYRGQRSRRR